MPHTVGGLSSYQYSGPHVSQALYLGLVSATMSSCGNDMIVDLVVAHNMYHGSYS